MRSLLFALALAACAPKKATVVRASASTPTAVAGVLDRLEDREVAALPASLDQAIQQALKDHNLVPEVVGADQFGKPFATRRATPHRLAWLAENAGGAKLLFLVQTEVEFYSQLSGRYRWTVKVTASVADASKPEEAVTSEFTVPVFLQFHHEREPEALEAAQPVIERQVGYLLDEYLGGM